MSPAIFGTSFRVLPKFSERGDGRTKPVEVRMVGDHDSLWLH
jgi:hypothetical protein